jgi:hypothetical protein
MAKRRELLDEIKLMFEATNLFQKVYTAQTQLDKENSFPVMWILLGDEAYPDATMQRPFRIIELTLRIAIQQKTGEDNMSPLLDDVLETLLKNYTLNGKVINTELVGLDTDDGLFYPHVLCDINCNLVLHGDLQKP